MGRKLAATIGLIAALLVTAPSSRAAVITQMLGTANYTNGETVGTGTFASNPSGDPAPFDRLIGDKTNGPNPRPASPSLPTAGQSRARSLRPPSRSASRWARPRAPRFSSLRSTEPTTPPYSPQLWSPTPHTERRNLLHAQSPSTDFAALATDIDLRPRSRARVRACSTANFILFGLDFATLTINTGAVRRRVSLEPSTWAMMILGFMALASWRIAGPERTTVSRSLRLIEPIHDGQSRLRAAFLCMRPASSLSHLSVVRASQHTARSAETDARPVGEFASRFRLSRRRQSRKHAEYVGYACSRRVRNRRRSRASSDCRRGEISICAATCGVSACRACARTARYRMTRHVDLDDVSIFGHAAEAHEILVSCVENKFSPVPIGESNRGNVREQCVIERIGRLEPAQLEWLERLRIPQRARG